MGTISLVLPSDGETIDASDVNTPFNTVANVINGNLDSNNIAANAITSVQATTGMCVQMQKTSNSALATGTTVIPYDDTIPQNTEGDEYLSLSYTPKATSNRLVIEALINISNSSGTVTAIAALFQDSTANALSANCHFMLTGTGEAQVRVMHEMAAGTTSATTFKIRAGFSGAGTTTLNGSAGARIFGGVQGSWLVIREYKS